MVKSVKQKAEKSLFIIKEIPCYLSGNNPIFIRYLSLKRQAMEVYIDPDDPEKYAMPLDKMDD